MSLNLTYLLFRLLDRREFDFLEDKDIECLAQFLMEDKFKDVFSSETITNKRLNEIFKYLHSNLYDDAHSLFFYGDIDDIKLFIDTNMFLDINDYKHILNNEEYDEELKLHHLLNDLKVDLKNNGILNKFKTCFHKNKNNYYDVCLIDMRE